jgi:hypothetical protein
MSFIPPESDDIFDISCPDISMLDVDLELCDAAKQTPNTTTATTAEIRLCITSPVCVLNLTNTPPRELSRAGDLGYVGNEIRKEKP